MSANTQFVSACYLCISSLINICVRRAAEAKEEKGYVKFIIIFACAVWDWRVVQNVSAISYWINVKIRLNAGSMYVAFLGVYYLNLISIFEGQKGKIERGERELC